MTDLPDIYDSLFQLQELDNSTDDLNARYRALQNEKAGVEKAIEDLNARIVESEQIRKEAQVRAHKHETEISNLEARIKGIEEKILRITSSKQLSALEAEKTGLQERLASEEEKLLEAYEGLEQAEARLKELNEAVDKERERKKTLEANAEKEMGQIKSQFLGNRAQRQELVQKVDPSLLESYTSLREEFKGPVLFVVEENGCLGCGEMLTGMGFRNLKNSERRPVACDNCGRLLFYDGVLE